MDPVFGDFLISVLGGFAIGIGLLLVPQRVLHRLASVPGLSPNWLSIWGVPLALAGVWLVVQYHTRIGFWMVVAALTLDRLDGKMATGLPPFPASDPRRGLERLWAELNHPGPTETGKWLDALTDKVKILPTLAWLAWRGDVTRLGTAIMVGLEIVSAVMRPPFSLFPASRLRGSAATGSGKLKVIAQAMTLLLVYPYYEGWFEGPPVAPSVALWIAVLFGSLSVASRIRFSDRVDSTVDSLSSTDFFRHDG